MIVKKFFKKTENKIILLIFLFSTLWFIFQHNLCVNWDFAAYVLNAKYWFAKGLYFEPLRPPITPFIIGLFGIFFDWKISEYLYIILVSSIFLFSSLKLAESLNLDRICFYAISLNTYVLLLGLFVGTELLSFAFIELFIAYLIRGKNSGHFLALSSLTRYNSLSFLPFLVYYKEPKKIMVNFLLFFLLWLPWFFYNYLSYSNIIASVFDNYLLNIHEREYIHQNFDIIHVLFVANFLTPLFLFGVARFFFSLKEKPITTKFFWKKKVEILMLLLFIITIFSYIKIPLKDPRFLFNLTLPIVYFSSVGMNFIKSSKKIFSIAIFITSLILSFTIIALESGFSHSCSEVYENAIKKINLLGKSNCSIMSNGWVYLNYLGQFSKPNPREEQLLPSIKEGELILLFYHVSEPEYIKNSTFLENLPVIYRNDEYILLGNISHCKKMEIFNQPYLNQLNQTVYKIYNYSIEMNYCRLLIKNKILSKLCSLITYLEFNELD